MESIFRSIRAYTIEISLMLALAASLGFFGYLGYGLVQPAPDTVTFSGEEALAHVQTQLDFGTRITGSPEHKAMGDWVIQTLSEQGWEVFDALVPVRLFDRDIVDATIIVGYSLLGVHRVDACA